MARIRSIKPTLWESEQLARVTLHANLVFIGLISHADDDGKQKASPTLIRGKLFGQRDDVSTADVSAWLQELHDAHLIDLYGSPDGVRQYCRLPTFSSHQRIDRKTKSAHPEPGKGIPIAPRMQTGFLQDFRDAVDESSSSTQRALVTGREGSGREKTFLSTAALADDVAPVEVRSVYDHWLAATNRNASAFKFTDGRKAKIKARLRNFTVGELKAAITFYANDPFWNGKQNDRGRFDDLTTIFRNDEKIEHALGNTAATAEDATARSLARFLEHQGVEQ